MKTWLKIESWAEKMENTKISILVWALGFLGIIATRMFIEFFVSIPALTFEQVLTEYLHNFFFFILAFLMIWLLLSLILKDNPVKLTSFFFFASWLIIFPPIFDMIKTGGDVYWSFYLLSDAKTLWLQFKTVFGHLPSGIVYFGTRIVFITAIILVTLLAYIKSKSLIKALISTLGTYLILFFMGAFPTFFVFFYYFIERSKKISEIRNFHVFQFFGTQDKIFGSYFTEPQYFLAYNLDIIYYLFLVGLLAVLFFFINKTKLIAIVKNARFSQILFHSGLFFAGLGLGYLAYPNNFHLNTFSVAGTLVLLVSIWLAWLASVAVNDIYDFGVDKISNPQRPLEKGIFTIEEYWEIGIFFFLLSILGGLVISIKFMALLIVYQFLAWTYSALPYRFKKIPFLATFISAVALLIVLFIGFTLFSGDQNIHGLSWRIIFLLLLGCILCLPIKDFKDLEGDKKNSVWTIPAIFGEDKARIIIAINFFVSFMLSVFFLNEFRLFWWALLFGGASFFVINNRNIKAWKLIWWNLAIVFIYGLILAKVVFL